jgi:ribonuclease D
VERLATAGEVALDTEGDSLHHYPARLSLIQLAEPGGEVFFVDPLAIADLAPLGTLLANSTVTIVLHAGDNDVIELKRRYRFTFHRVFDTSIAARLLGMKTLGLDALLEAYLGVALPPSRQKDDWSARPLSAAQEAYAAADVQHLFLLRARLTTELERIGRLPWAEEECAALAAQAAPERPVDPDAFMSVKGARDLPPRGLVILRELYETRELLARAADRPPFKILGEDVLLKLAIAAPVALAELAQVPGCTPRVVGLWGTALLDAVAHARTVPDGELPRLPRRSRPPGNPAAARRAEALKRWRSEVSPRYGLEPGVVLPNRVIAAIADAAPRDAAALRRVEGMREWRVREFGGELLRVVLDADSGRRER